MGCISKNGESIGEQVEDMGFPTEEEIKNLNNTKTEVIVEGIKCAFCRKGKGTESITDSETLLEVLICSDCEHSLDWERFPTPPPKEEKKELTPKQEDFMIESQLEDFRLKRDNIEL